MAQRSLFFFSLWPTSHGFTYRNGWAISIRSIWQFFPTRGWRWHWLIVDMVLGLAHAMGHWGPLSLCALPLEAVLRAQGPNPTALGSWAWFS